MRLGDIPLGLEHRHIIAHGGAGNSQIVLVDQCFRPDRLLGRDVVRDNRAQDLQPPPLGTRHRAHLLAGHRVRTAAFGQRQPRGHLVDPNPV